VLISAFSRRRLKTMPRRLALALLALLAVTACTAKTGPTDGGVGTSSAALRSGAAATWPPRVDVPLGASREHICARNDGDTKASFREHAKGHELGHFVLESDAKTAEAVWVCRYCDLDGQVIKAPPDAGGNIRIEDSTMANATIQADWIAYLRLRNVYARGVHFQGMIISVEGENVDLRCAWGDGNQQSFGFNLNNDPGKAIGFDMAGSSALELSAYGTVADLRLTGAAISSLAFQVASLSNARLDNVTVASGIVFERDCVAGDRTCQKWQPTTLSGKLRFDGTPALAVRFDNAVLHNAKISLGGSRGSLILSGTNTFDGVTLEGNDGGVRLTGDLGALRLTEKTTWPVGATGLVPDADLTKLDLSNAVLTPAPNEKWPAGPLVLDGLRLAHGGFADGMDLSQVSLKGAKLERVHFGAVTLSRMEQQVPRGAIFDDASLEQAHFDQQALDGVSFVGADLRGASFAGASGTASFQRVKASRLPAHTDDNDTDRAVDTSFDGAQLGASRFDDALLQYATFRRAKLSDVAFDRATADWADFSSARFFRRVKDSPGISNTTLAKMAGLHGAFFDGADLRGVSLAGLDLSPSNGQASSFVGTYLCGADLTGTKLRGANLSGALFDVTGNVTFPAGSIGPCTPGKRDGADTSSMGAAITACPLRGEAPSGPGGMCADAQWRIEGSATCSPDQTRTARRNGAPCTTKCDCQSLFCNAQRTCADGK
jgi:uncharacterized protein YjbI with pentapeptide repeats